MNQLLTEIKNKHYQLEKLIKKTPILSWDLETKNNYLSNKTEVFLKAELFQKTGTFKIRGVLSRLLSLSEDEKQKGVVAGTGGNHGIALAYGAKLMNIKATIVIPKTINPFRLNQIKAYDAEIIEVDNINLVLDQMNEIAKNQNKTVIHPYDHPLTSLGTATLGYEFLNEAKNLEAIIVSVGGGGLISGVAMAAKEMNPDIKIYGVEPQKADVLNQSLKANKAIKLKHGASSIADSLNAPEALAYSFSLCQKYVDEMVLVSDDEIKKSMTLAFEELKLAIEPACAASIAALVGPLKTKIIDKKVGVILCGSNIDFETFSKLCLN